MDVVRAVAAKELLYLRRNTGLFYGLVMPLVMVMIFAGRWTVRAGTHGPLIFLSALAYGLLGVFPMSFNSFGLEGTGAQTYFFAPVRLREVMIGKNLLCAGVALTGDGGDCGGAVVLGGTAAGGVSGGRVAVDGDGNAAGADGRELYVDPVAEAD